MMAIREYLHSVDLVLLAGNLSDRATSRYNGLGSLQSPPFDSLGLWDLEEGVSYQSTVSCLLLYLHL